MILTKILSLVFLLPVVAVQDKDKDAAARQELIKLQGDWKLVTGQASGQEMPANIVAAFTMTVKDNQYEFRNNLETEKGLLVLSPTAKPAQIDIIINDGSHKGFKQLGIYEWNGKKIKFCVTQPGDDKRPEKFVTTAENQYLIFEFEQVKK